MLAELEKVKTPRQARKLYLQCRTNEMRKVVTEKWDAITASLLEKAKTPRQFMKINKQSHEYKTRAWSPRY